MDNRIDLEALASELGPKFGEGAAERDESNRFVAENYLLLKEHKVFSAQIPAELGGGGATHGEMCGFVRTIGRHCGPTALTLSMHQHLVAAAVFNHAHGKPGQKLLEKVVAGETVLVSTGANDWLASNGAMERTDGGYLVSAAKPFASGSPVGQVMVTSAPYEDPEEGWQVLHFPVPLSAEGVSLAGDWDTMGMRATGSQTVVFDKVFVPEEAVALRRPRDAYHPAYNVILTVAMPLIVSAYVGIAEAAAEIATGMAARRAGDPVAPYLLGELTNHLTTAQLAADSMVAIANDLAFDPVTETANAILVRKTIAASAVMATAEKALETAGGGGFFRKSGLERLVRDAHGIQFHPLQEKRQQHFTGRMALGLDPIEMPEEQKLPAAAE
jgi:alkylation response protein AidB-like acyl-CoA dehydrogenase